MIALPSVEKCILACSGCIEVVGAAYHHYSGVVVDEGCSNAMRTESFNNHQYISVCSYVVVTEEVYCVHGAKVIVKEACQEGICLVGAETILVGPIHVVLG